MNGFWTNFMKTCALCYFGTHSYYSFLLDNKMKTLPLACPCNCHIICHENLWLHPERLWQAHFIRLLLKRDRLHLALCNLHPWIQNCMIRSWSEWGSYKFSKFWDHLQGLWFSQKSTWVALTQVNLIKSLPRTLGVSGRRREGRLWKFSSPNVVACGKDFKKHFTIQVINIFLGL